MSSPIVFSYRLDGLGKASKESSLKKNSEGLLWTHLDANHENIKDSIKKFSDLDPIIVDALIAAETRPRMLQSHGGLLLILRESISMKNLDLKIWFQLGCGLIANKSSVYGSSNLMQFRILNPN